MTYVTPVTLTPGTTVKASTWNLLVNNIIDLNTRVASLEAGTAGTVDYSSFPIYAIVAYSGGSASLPSGWYVCNGGTISGTVLPDLRAKFIYGASIDTDLAVTSGGTAHTHTNPDTSSGGDHSHSATGSTGGPTSTTGVASGSGTNVGTSGHTHDVSVSLSGGSHSHAIGVTGSGSNMPPYVKLYYITRLG